MKKPIIDPKELKPYQWTEKSVPTSQVTKALNALSPWQPEVQVLSTSKGKTKLLLKLK
jgi:hypothetical protein